MDDIGAAISLIIKNYWDVLCAMFLFMFFIFKLKYSIDFMSNRIDYEITRLREYVDIKNDSLYEKISDIKRSIDAIAILVNETSSQNRDELRLLSQRVDKFIDIRN